MMANEIQLPRTRDGIWPKLVNPLPSYLKGAYFDKRRNRKFYITEVRKYATGQIVVDMVGPDGSFQQFTVEFFKQLCLKGELIRTETWN